MITKEQLIKKRKQAGLKKSEAAELVHMKYRQWYEYEAGTAAINQPAAELFFIKANAIIVKKQNDPYDPIEEAGATGLENALKVLSSKGQVKLSYLQGFWECESGNITVVAQTAALAAVRCLDKQD